MIPELKPEPNGWPPPPPPLHARILLTGGPASVSINNGQSVALQFTVERIVTEAPVALGVLGLPPGVTASFSPPSLPAASVVQKFTLTLTAAANATAAVENMRVEASATGALPASEAVMVTVVSPYTFIPGAPILQIGPSGETTASSQTPVVLAAFGQAAVPFNLQFLAGVTGTVSFSFTGAPATEVTAHFSPLTLSAPPAPGYVAVTATLTAGPSISPASFSVTCEVLVNSELRGSFGFPLRLVAPFVSSVSPQAGSVPVFGSPGTSVVITGGGFGPGTTVAFGADSPVAPVSVAGNGTSLVVQVPATAASGQVQVVSPAGQASGAPDFAVDNYRNTRGFSWGNSDQFQDLVGGSYSEADATALFGSSQTIISIGIFGIKFFNPLVDAFLAIANALLDSGGQCFGMSLGSLRFAAGQMSPSGLPQQAADAEPNGPAGPDAWLLAGPQLGDGNNVSPSLATFVHRQHLAQLSQESINNWVGFHASVTTAAGLRAALQQAFTAGGAAGMGAIVDLNPSTSEGHAVVAYEIVDTADGGFDILLYNPNAPFDMGLADLSIPPGQIENEDQDPNYRATQAARSVIHVMSDGNWSATLNVSGPPTWTGGIFNLTVVPWNTIPPTPTIPWLEIAAAGALAAAVIWIVTGDAAVSQVSDGQGHLLLAGGQWNTDPATMLPGVRPLPAFGGLGKTLPPAFASISQATLIHTITGQAEGSYDLLWIGNGYSVAATGVATAPGSADTVQMTAGGISVTPAEAKTVSVTVTGIGSASGLPRTAALQAGASAGALLGLSFDPSGETFSYVNAGAAASYSLELSTIDTAGQPVSFAAPAPAAGNGDRLTFKPDWNQPGAGTGIITVRSPGGEVTNLPL